MIDEKKLAELQLHYRQDCGPDCGTDPEEPECPIDLEEFFKTLEALWKENAELKAENAKLQETMDLLNHDFCANLKQLKAVARAAERLIQQTLKGERHIDHACSECGGTLIRDDFRCGWHATVEALAALKEIND